MNTACQLSRDVRTLAVNTTGRQDIIAWSNLVRIEAESNYSRLILANGKSLFVARVLRKFEDELDRRLFVRTHKTHLVNKSFIISFTGGVHASLVLSNGERIPVARRRKNLFARIGLSH